MVGLRYLALSVGLLTLLSSLGYIPQEHAFGSSALYLTVVLALFCGWFVGRELRRDLYQFCTYWVFFGFVCGMGSLLLSFDHRILGVLSGGLCVATWVASIVLLVRARWVKDERPNQLLLHFAREHIFEHAGVQIAVEVPDADRLAEGLFDVRVFVQNCWDMERAAAISLHARRGLFEMPGGAEIATASEPLALSGGAVGVLSIPVRVTTTSRLALHVSLRTSGAGGRRIWRRPAQPIPMRVSPLATILLGLVSFGTFWAWGGGLTVRVPRGPRKVAPAMPFVRRWHAILERR